MSFKKIEFLTNQLKLSFEENFLHGNVNRKGEVIVEKIYKDKMMAHIFSLYFALTNNGNYTLPIGWITTDLQITEGVSKTMLQNIGCM